MKLAYFITLSLVFNAIITICLVWLVFVLIPDLSSSETGSKSTKSISVSDKPTNREKLHLAVERLVVVYPIVLAFFFFQWSGALLVLIFIAILSVQPGFASNFRAGKALIAGNTIGGIVAIFAYEILVIVPEYYFVVILMFLAGLVFSQKLFSNKPTAPLYGMAFSTFLLIVGQSTSGTDDAGGKVWLRVIEIMVSVIYVVLAFGIINYFKEHRMIKKANKLTKKDILKSNTI